MGFIWLEFRKRIQSTQTSAYACLRVSYREPENRTEGVNSEYRLNRFKPYLRKKMGREEDDNGTDRIVRILKGDGLG